MEVSVEDATLSLPSLPTPSYFRFPYPNPYDIQLQLMQTVFRAIEDRKIAIVGYKIPSCRVFS